jgi:hypothetical protein
LFRKGSRLLTRIFLFSILILDRESVRKYFKPTVLLPEELFTSRDFEHSLGTLPVNRSVPAARQRLGQSSLSEAQGKFED